MVSSEPVCKQQLNTVVISWAEQVMNINGLSTGFIVRKTVTKRAWVSWETANERSVFSTQKVPKSKIILATEV